jgi:hypothetical protein
MSHNSRTIGTKTKTIGGSPGGYVNYLYMARWYSFVVVGDSYQIGFVGQQLLNLTDFDNSHLWRQRCGEQTDLWQHDNDERHTTPTTRRRFKEAARRAARKQTRYVYR